MLEHPPYRVGDETEDRGSRPPVVPPIPLTPILPKVITPPPPPPAPPLPTKSASGVGIASVGPAITFRPGVDEVKIAYPPVAQPLAEAQRGEDVGAAARVSVSAVTTELPVVRAPLQINMDHGNRTLSTPNVGLGVASSGALAGLGAIPKSSSTSLALRRLADYNAPGRREDDSQPKHLRSVTRRAQDRDTLKLQTRRLPKIESEDEDESREGEEEDEVVAIAPMREMYRAAADVKARVHYPWLVWDLISLKERCPVPDLEIDKFTEYFLSALRAQRANWADTKVLLQKLLPPVKYRDVMALWDWGDDMADVPTYPKRLDGTGNIAAGPAGDDARTTALVQDIKDAFPKKPPLQRLENCVFAKDDTAYSFMDKTREAFTQIMGPGAADNEAFRPFILNHYVTHLPTVVSQRIKNTVGWESFTFAAACTHAAHHLKHMGEEKKEKKERLLALQLQNLEGAPLKCPQHSQQQHSPQQHLQQHAPPVGEQPGLATHNSRRGRRRQRGGARGGGSFVDMSQKQCSRCGGYGHYARHCMAAMPAGQVNVYGQSQLPAWLPQQPVVGPPPGQQSTLNVNALPFYQNAYYPQQTGMAPGHQPAPQFRTA